MSDAEAENRALNAAELDMVNGTRSPAIEQKTKDELKALVHRLRQAHSRANDISVRQQREMRGKAEPHGARRAQESAGNVLKARLLLEAVHRIDQELSRREEVEIGRPSQTDFVRRALELKMNAAAPPHPDPGRTPSKGIRETNGSIHRRHIQKGNGPRLPSKAAQARKDSGKS